MLELARSLGVKVQGLSFHVGSQVAEPKKYVEAIGVCAELIERASATGLADLNLLDIGGGFPIAYGGTMQPIREFCRPIRQALKKLPRGVRVIAEPGRFIAGRRAPRSPPSSAAPSAKAAGGTTSTTACTARTTASCTTTRAIRSTCPAARVRRTRACLRVPRATASTSCARTFPLPELQIGDLVVGRMMGAYTACSATDFNFIPRAKIVALNVQARSRRAD